MSKFVMRRNILEFWSPKFIISPLKDSVSVDVAVKKLDLHSCRRTEDVHLTLSRSNCIVRRSLSIETIASVLGCGHCRWEGWERVAE